MHRDDSLHAIGMRQVRRALSAGAWVVGVAIVVAGGLWYWLQPKSFDECMIAQLRNGPRHIYTHVEKVCQSRFPEPSAKLPDIDFTDRRQTAAEPDVPWAPASAGLPAGFVLDPKPVSGTR